MKLDQWKKSQDQIEVFGVAAEVFLTVKDVHLDKEERVDVAGQVEIEGDGDLDREETSNMNICTRCGKPRIVISSYVAQVEKSTVTYTITACSDPECQKIVDRNLKNEEVKRAAMRDEQEKRALQRAMEKKLTREI